MSKIIYHFKWFAIRNKILGLKSLKQRFVYFGQNSSIHGLNHLFRKNAIFLARLFWLTIMVISCGCLYLLLGHDHDLEGDISFTPDTLYINWTTNFPAVTVCEMFSSSSTSLSHRLKNLYPDLFTPLSFDQSRYVADLLYGRAKCSPTRCVPCGTFVPCDVPWRTIVENVRKSCDEMVTDCSYMGEEFPCCTIFHPVDSEFGPCVSFNTLQNTNFLQRPLFTANRITGPGSLKFRLKSNSLVTVHSSEELSTNNLGPEYEFSFYADDHEEAEILFSVVEMENDLMVEQIAIEERACRYPHEVPKEPFHTYTVYSYGACKLARSTDHSFKHCGCVSPIRDLSYENYYCNYTGLNCLAQYEVQRKLGLDIDVGNECLPSCVENEISIIHDKRRKSTDHEYGKGNMVTLKMVSLPTLRYRRNLLRTDLDFVVSVGGIVDLFFSASLLSIVEIFYLILRTPNRLTI